MSGLGIQVTDLTLRYGRGAPALDRLSLTLAPGKIYGLVGRNGSGKTSLLSVLAAFRRPSSGTVRIDGADPFENERLAGEICLIREGGDLFQHERGDRVLALAGLLRPRWDEAYAQRLVERFGLPLRQPPSALSRGQRSALACTLGLASRAPLTMFDESYLGMDAPTRYVLYDELLTDYAAHPRTIILSTHLIEEFGALFEEVVVIDRGRLLVHDEVDEVRARGTAVTGPADAVDRVVADLQVLHRRRLGDTTSATVYGPLTGQQRQAATAAGVALDPLPLQDLLVHLTSPSGDPASSGVDS